MNKKKQIQKKQQNYDSEGDCASIQKAFFEQDSIQKIISENFLKKMALEKAESLINVLTIQVERLKKQKIKQDDIYQNQLKNIIQNFNKKQVFLKNIIASLKEQLKQQRKGKIYQFNQQIYKSNQRKLSNLDNNNQYLSRQFTSGKKIKKKVTNVEDPDWKSDNIIINQNLKIFDKLSMKFYFEELQINNNVFQTFQQQCQEELQLLEQLKYNHKQKIIQVSKLSQKEHAFDNKNYIKSKIQLFNHSSELNPHLIDQIKQPKKTYPEIIKQYSQLLQQYKEYSAYLKAYLCSCLNFVNKMTQTYFPVNSLNEQIQKLFQDKNQFEFQRSDQIEDKRCEKSILSTSRTQNYVLNIPDIRISSIITKKVVKIFKSQLQMANQTIYCLQNQNKQLRKILDQLVHNLKLKQSRKNSLYEERIITNHNKTSINKNIDKNIEQKYLQSKSKHLHTLTQQNQDNE